MREDLLQHIDRLIQQRPVSKAALVAFRELVFLTVQADPKVKPVALEAGLRDIKRNEGFPLFSREDLPLDFDNASNLLKRFLEHLAGSNRDDKEGLRRALEKSQPEREWCLKLFKAILARDDETQSGIGKAVDLDPKVLHFLGRMALSPSLHALRHVLADRIGKEGWDHGYCPMCGSQPGMAYIAKSGKRYLCCELCGEEWAYHRMTCPFCENQDHGTLGYFEAEQEEGFRVDFCRKCLRYLKAVDRRVFEEATPMDLEDLATIHLDVLAAQHGFR